MIGRRSLRQRQRTVVTDWTGLYGRHCPHYVLGSTARRTDLPPSSQRCVNGTEQPCAQVLVRVQCPGVTSTCLGHPLTSRA